MRVPQLWVLQTRAACAMPIRIAFLKIAVFVIDLVEPLPACIFGDSGRLSAPTWLGIELELYFFAIYVIRSYVERG